MQPKFALRSLLSVLISGLFIVSHSEKTLAQASKQDLQKIYQWLSIESRGFDDLMECTEKVGHRLSGTQHGRDGEEFMMSKLKGYGFNQVEYIPFKLNVWERSTCGLEIAPMKSDNFSTFPAMSLANTPSADLSAPIIDVGNGLPADFEKAGDDCNGKIVMLNIGLENAPAGTKNLHRSEKMALAEKAKATGVIMLHPNEGNKLMTGTASLKGELTGIPAINISKESSAQIRTWLKTEKLVAFINVKNKFAPGEARNIKATIPGSAYPDEKIIVCAHLDSWDLGNGATDNGLGSFTILDMARAIKNMGVAPARTIEFIWFMGEEQGLKGSKAYVQTLKQNGGLDKIKLVMNLDMTANVTGMNSFDWAGSKAWYKKLNKHILEAVPSYPGVVQANPWLHSDHQPFMLEGIPVAIPVGHLNDKVLSCYHSDCDNMEEIDKTYMQNSAAHTAMWLWLMANEPKVPTKRLNDRQTQKFFEKHHFDENLKISADWKWN